VKRVLKKVATSPMTLVCPRCGARPGKICELFDGEVELVHVDRIDAATLMDAAAKKAKKK
jgi:hypothetical protein